MSRLIAIGAAALVATAGLLVAPAAPAQAAGTQLVTEQFSGTSVIDPAWRALNDACLTQATVAPPAGRSNLGVCQKRANAPASSVNPGFLQLTDASGTATGGVVYNSAIPGNGGLLVEFDQWQYGGDGADGIGFFLTDGSTNLTATGAPGGSLGYSQRGAGEPGVNGGYLGVGLDAWGNYSNPSEGRDADCVAPNRGPGQRANSVALRGPGQGFDGYCYLAGTPSGLIAGTPGLSLRDAGTTASTGRSVRITVSADTLPVVTVFLDFKDGQGYRQVLAHTMAEAAPATYKFGFLGSTGGSTDTHLIRNVSIASLEPLGALNIVKQIDNRTPQPATYGEGSTIPYSFVVSNTSSLATLTNVQVVDPAATNIVCPRTTLGPVGSATPSMTCTGAHVVTAAEALASSFVNTAHATGLDGANAVRSNDSSVSAPMTPATPALSVVKRAVLIDGDGDGLGDAGDEIQYAFDVENTGNVTVQGVAIDDPRITGTTPATAILAPGATQTFTATTRRAITQADVDAGTPIENTASAAGSTADGTPVESAPSDADVALVAEAGALEMTKRADLATVSAAGQVVTYTFDVTNRRNVRVDGISIVDSAFTGTGDLSAISCVATSLAPNASTECTATYTVTTDDLELDEISNTAYAQGTSSRGTAVRSADSTADVTVAVPGFSLEKTRVSESGDVVQPGDVVTYTVTARNTGETALSGVTVSDDLAGVLGAATWNDDLAATTGTATRSGDAISWAGSLAVGASVAITYSVTVDADAGGETIANVATASATPPVGDAIVPPAATTTDRVLEPGFALVKTATPATGTAVDPGDVIEYRITASNTGETGLDAVSVADDLSGVLAGATWNDDLDASVGTATRSGDAISWTGGLAAGAQVVISYSVTVAPDAGGETIANRATASATPPGGLVLTPPAAVTTHDVNEPGFALTKTVDPADGTAVAAGDELTYTIRATNTGETVLTPVEVADDLSGVLAGASLVGTPSASLGAAPQIVGDELAWSGALEVGEEVVITYTVRVESDAAGTTIENSATARATAPGGLLITPPATSTSNRVLVPGFTLVKASTPGDGTPVDAGSTITWTLTAANTGETALEPVSIADDLSGVLAHAELASAPTADRGDAPVVTGDDLTWSGRLGVGESVVITYAVTVDADAAGETLVNSAVGSATPPGGQAIAPPTETTTHGVNVPGFTLVKTVDPASGAEVHPGDVLTYTVRGTNTGATALSPVRIQDDLSSVLEAADYRGDAASTRGPQPTFTAGVLRWEGALPVGGDVVITYSVIVSADAPGSSLRNSAAGEATTPGGGTIVPPPSTTINDVPVPGFALTKTTDLPAGAEANPGDTITYTVTASNTGETTLDPVAVRDDLSGVLAGADRVGDAAASIGAAPTVSGNQLAWDGVLDIGESVVITYSVVVRADAPGSVLVNRASASATPPGGEPIEPPAATTSTTVPVPGFSLVKTVDAGSAAVAPGDVLVYTLTGSNTGATALDPVEIVDDLSGVLGAATYRDDATASIGGAPATDPVLAGETLTWSGELQVGEVVVITYSVRVDADAAGSTIANSATGSATPPGGEPIVPPVSSTSNEVPEPGFSLEKRANPGAGAAVLAGQPITYTVTAANTGATVLDPVKIVDDLSRVLDKAELRGPVQASLGEQPTVQGTTLTWTGRLGVGERVVLTYTVVASAGAVGSEIVNSVAATAMPPGGPAISSAGVTTSNPVTSSLASTGLDATAALAAGGLAMLLGLAGILAAAVRRRRQRDRV